MSRSVSLRPLAGLDADTAARVASRLRDWLTGRTALVLAHDVDALPRSDRVLRLEAGRLVTVR